MRFDDSLKTVLAADTSTAFGAQSAFRQLVDMAGRGRTAADAALIERLRMLRPTVPVAVRAAAARALALAAPDAALVAFFAEDEASIAAPVLRTAMLDDADWMELLAALGPVQRGILRQRRDLSPNVQRAIATFGSVDFVLPQPDGRDATVVPPVPAEVPVAPVRIDQPPAPPMGVGPFVPLGDIARALPFVARARREAMPDAAPADTTPAEAAPRFEIADLVDRIAEFQRGREGEGEDGDRAPVVPAPPVTDFRFETDAAGAIRWTDHAARAALVGVTIAAAGPLETRAADGVAGGALRHRSAFSDARLTVSGTSDAAGSWRISAVPVFDEASGRFLGYRGTARRPRIDEEAAHPERDAAGASEGLRRLVHELRTPTTAIAGFAELIEMQLFGPVPDPYRERATLIRSQTADLIAAIDDLDTAARIEGRTLDLRSGATAIGEALHRIVGDLAPLAVMRGCVLAVDPVAPDIGIAGDERVVDRLLGRLAATVVAAAAPGERITLSAGQVVQDAVAVRFDRPRALVVIEDDTLLAIDAESEASVTGAPLLGSGFALRLARNLAVELGGSFVMGKDHLTLRLPAVLGADMEQATNR